MTVDIRPGARIRSIDWDTGKPGMTRRKVVGVADDTVSVACADGSVYVLPREAVERYWMEDRES